MKGSNYLFKYLRIFSLSIFKGKYRLLVTSSVGVMLILSVLVVTFNNLNAQTRELIIQHRKFQGEYKSLLPVGYGPSDIQINVKTNKIYVANSGSDSVSVIDSDSGNRKTIRVDAAPTSIAVDEILNKIYVTNSGSDTVSVIDGYTDNKTRDIVVDKAPRIIAADTDDHKIYVSSAYRGNNIITVIDAKVDRKIKDISFGDQTPVKIIYFWPAVMVLTQGRGNGTFSTIDPQHNDTLNLNANKIPVGPEPMDMAVGYNRSGFHKIYVINRWPDYRGYFPYTTSMVYVVHSSAIRHDMDYLRALDRSHRFDIYLGHKPAPLSFLLGQTKAAVKIADREPCCNHGLVYATNSDSVSIINMTTDTLLHDVLLPRYPNDIALGNVSKDTRYPKVYVANGASGTVSIINGTAKTTQDIPVGISPTRIVYNPTWNMIYVLGYTPHTTAYLNPQLRNGSVSVIDGATDKVAAGVIFNVNPANSGNITCNNETYPTNTYIYVDSGTNCKVQNNNGFDFINWVELTNRNASIALKPSSDPENLIVDRYGIFTANFKQERPLSADQLFTYLTGAISAAVAVNGVILLVPGWRRARNQRTHLRECIQMIDNDAGKSHKDAIEEKIIGYYVDGKLSEDHRQLLNDKISEYYGSVKGSESGAPF